MPIVINDFQVTQDQPRTVNPETPAAQPAAPAKPNPEEIRRLLLRMAERLMRIQAH